MTVQPEKCKTCRVDWKRCGLRLQNCTKTFPISNMELELILQMNENLPTDEMELVIRDLIVMDIREYRSRSYPSLKQLPLCFGECSCDGILRTRCSYLDDCYEQEQHNATIAAQAREDVLDELAKEIDRVSKTWHHACALHEIVKSLRHREVQE